MTEPVTVIGGGFAGVEAAKQLSKRGIPVRLFEMKPQRFSPAHKSPALCELVCSNSFKAARVETAAGLLKAEMERLRLQVTRYQKLFPDSITPYEMENVEKLYESSVAAWQNAQAELQRVKAGVSAFQIEQAEAEILQIQARLNSLDTQLQESMLRSPIDGRVMKINVHQGEYISLFNPVRDDTTSTPVVVGSSALQVRVDVDETDISRIRPDCAASACLHGDLTKTFALKFNRIQPMVVPKRNLAGYGMERIDVRVIQIIFDVIPPAFPLLSGLQVDVYLHDNSGT